MSEKGWIWCLFVFSDFDGNVLFMKVIYLVKMIAYTFTRKRGISFMVNIDDVSVGGDAVGMTQRNNTAVGGSGKTSRRPNKKFSPVTQNLDATMDLNMPLDTKWPNFFDVLYFASTGLQ